jgi:hypothetical protein
MAYPIATLLDGRIKYSDGTTRSANASYIDSNPNPVASMLNGGVKYGSGYISTPSPDPMSVSESSSGSSSGRQSMDWDQFSQEADAYADELINEAKGDYDFVAKWVENSYKLALGEDDQERAKFLKSVANGLEQKIGRIAFDYETGKYRTEEDMKLGTERTTQARDLALKRLAEDEKVYVSDFNKQAGIDRQNQAESLSERGLLSGARGTEGGLEGRSVQELETNLQDKLGAYQRTLGRDRENIGISSSQNLADIQRAGERQIFDLTTGARRDATNTQNSRDQNIEQAQRVRDAAIAEAERQRFSEKSYADRYKKLYGSTTI